MRVGVNVPNFGPGTNPDSLARWAEVVEGLGFDLLMVSDHLAVTSDVAEQYPAPFYEPFTTLAWLAGITTRITLGTTVLIVPYRHPLLIARMAANLQLPVPDLAPRIVLRLAEKPIDHPERRAGEGTIGQILDDIEQLSLLGAGTVLLDPYNGDPNETLRPEAAWQALATVAAHRAWPTPYRDGIAVTLDNHDLPGSDVDRAAAFSEADLQHL